MKNTREDFLIYANESTDESDIDRICLQWIRMFARDNGKEGEFAVKLLNMVEDLIY